jgi:hypothetical protein
VVPRPVSAVESMVMLAVSQPVWVAESMVMPVAAWPRAVETPVVVPEGPLAARVPLHINFHRPVSVTDIRSLIEISLVTQPRDEIKRKETDLVSDRGLLLHW